MNWNAHILGISFKCWLILIHQCLKSILTKCRSIINIVYLSTSAKPPLANRTAYPGLRLHLRRCYIKPHPEKALAAGISGRLHPPHRNRTIWKSKYLLLTLHRTWERLWRMELRPKLRREWNMFGYNLCPLFLVTHSWLTLCLPSRCLHQTSLKVYIKECDHNSKLGWQGSAKVDPPLPLDICSFVMLGIDVMVKEQN